MSEKIWKLIAPSVAFHNYKYIMAGQGKVFADRREAGYELGKLIKKYADRHVLVLGIPRGGVEVACEVARTLNGELTVVITKKLPHPEHTEFAIGAVAEDNSIYLNPLGRTVDQSRIERIVAEQAGEIQSRIQRFRNGMPLPVMEDRIVIIVDDSITTGSTIVPAINLCKKRNAAKVIVAAPVSSRRDSAEIFSIADEVAVVIRPRDFFSVGQVYEHFHSLSDEEVVSLLRDFDPHTANEMLQPKY